MRAPTIMFLYFGVIMPYINHTSLTSFVGDVRPLILREDGADLKNADIKWSCDSDVVTVRGFSGGDGLDRCYHYRFTDGVLVSFKKPGKANVTAEYDGKKYTCAIEVTYPKTVPASRPDYYIGDLHDHVTGLHDFQKFCAAYDDGTLTYPKELVDYVKTKGHVDFCAISDHSDIIHDRMFFDGFTAFDDAQPMDGIIFPGTESEISKIETDRYGTVHKNSGEMVMMFADSYVGGKEWSEYYAEFDNNDACVGVFAHPQVPSYGGVWNFSFDKNRTPELISRMRLVEMGNGTDREANLVNEYVYSAALDNGFKVSVSCSSDSHGGRWGDHPGKTVIMAHEKSREAFYNALRNNRVYATESASVKLWYTVNGKAAPCTLENTDKYAFRVEVGVLEKGDPEAMPVVCKVISDYGKCVKEVECQGLCAFEFEVESDTARYFYLRLSDKDGRRTWSCPVWTGREFDAPIKSLPGQYVVGKADSALRPIDKAGFTAFDEVTGADLSAVVSDNISSSWTSTEKTASVVIDMQSERTVRGVGHYPEMIDKAVTKAAGINTADIFAGFASGCRISVSCDGENWTQCADGIVRIFGAEVIAAFEPVSARYVKYEVTSTVGRDSGMPKYLDALLTLNELTVFE